MSKSRTRIPVIAALFLLGLAQAGLAEAKSPAPKGRSPASVAEPSCDTMKSKAIQDRCEKCHKAHKKFSLQANPARKGEIEIRCQAPN